MKNKSILLLLIIFFTSCQKVLKMYLGFNENLGIESTKRQHKYLNKKNIDTTNTYNFNLEEKPDFYNKKNRLDNVNDITISPIQFRVFNKEKKFESGWQVCFGKLEFTGLLDTFPIKKLDRNYNPNLTFENQIKLIENYKLKEPNLIQEDMDLYIFAFWSESTGKLSRNMLKELDTYKRKYSDKKIQIIKINISNIIKFD